MQRLSPIFALLGPIAALSVHAETYLTSEQAVAILFPDAKLTAQSVVSPVDGRALKRWSNAAGDAVYVDQVIGKHELITFAVGIAKGGAIKGIEILEYRESYGGQVKNSKWRAQFVGKTVASPLKIDDDISNISGATLSSNHITDGIRRILKAHAELTASAHGR